MTENIKINREVTANYTRECNQDHYQTWKKDTLGGREKKMTRSKFDRRLSASTDLTRPSSRRDDQKHLNFDINLS